MKSEITLQELTTRLQTLCHDGFSQSSVQLVVEGFGTISPEEIELLIKSDVMKDGFIKVRLG